MSMGNTGKGKKISFHQVCHWSIQSSCVTCLGLVYASQKWKFSQATAVMYEILSEKISTLQNLFKISSSINVVQKLEVQAKVLKK